MDRADPHSGFRDQGCTRGGARQRIKIMKMGLPTPATSPDPLANEAADLQRARAGDRPAFRRLVLFHQDRVFSLALRITGHPADAEELAQDAFLQLHGAMAQVTSPAHLKHWLLRTVAHRAIDRLRQAARRGHVLSLEALDGRADQLAPEPGGDPMAAAHLHRLLLKLQPDARAVVLLHYQEDLDVSDIATVLEMPVNTVKSHLRRSMEWLRARCAGEEHGA
jgi:RNA polymerase sigma-70 factor (ECF subfamily)